MLLAGVLAYFEVGFGAYAAMIFVFGGAALVFVVFAGHRPRPWDIAFAVIAILVLSGVASGSGYGRTQTSYSATKDQVHVHAISLTVSAGLGSVDVGFTSKPGLAYQVNFSRSVFGFWPGEQASVTNSTSGGVFTLDVQSSGEAVSVLLGRGYLVNVDLSTSTGSVSFEATDNETLGDVSLVSSTGSVSAVIDSSTLRSVTLNAGTGSVSLYSNSLGTSTKSVPVALSASTGSVDVHVSIQTGDAVSLSASTSLGTVNHSGLAGFAVTQDTRTNLAASAGDAANSRGSFVISATSNLGSVNLDLTLGA